MVLLAGLQRPNPDHLTRNLLAFFVSDRNDHAVLARLAAPWMVNGTLNTHRRNRFRLRLGIAGIEAQVMLAARADVRTLQHRCLAVWTYPGRAKRSARASDIHC
jgi:hypothetical protein